MITEIRTAGGNSQADSRGQSSSAAAPGFGDALNAARAPDSADSIEQADSVGGAPSPGPGPGPGLDETAARSAKAALSRGRHAGKVAGTAPHPAAQRANGRSTPARPESVSELLATIASRHALASEPQGAAAPTAPLAAEEGGTGTAKSGATKATNSESRDESAAQGSAIPPPQLQSTPAAAAVATALARAPGAPGQQVGTDAAMAAGTSASLPATEVSASARSALRGLPTTASTAGDVSAAPDIAGTLAPVSQAGTQAPGAASLGPDEHPRSAAPSLASGPTESVALGAQSAAATAAMLSVTSDQALDPDADRRNAQAAGIAAMAAAVNAAASIGGPGPLAGPEQTAGPIAQPTQFSLDVAVSDPGFPTALAGQVDQIVLQGIDNAEILVTPRGMGPIKVELSLSGESASLAFSAMQPETRQAIEQSLPTLRSMLAEHGILLADASVGQQRDPRQDDRASAARSDAEGSLAGGDGGPTSAGGGIGAARVSRVRAGLLDLYA